MSAIPIPRYGFVPEWTIGDRLRRARESVGLTQTELAEECGISQRTVSNYEAEFTQPTLLNLYVWSAVCQVSLPWLAWGDPDREDPSPKNWRRARKDARSLIDQPTIWLLRSPLVEDGFDSTPVSAS